MNKINKEKKEGKEKLIHSSFRLEENVLEILQDKASHEDLSLSKLVNKILKGYVRSEMQFKQLGFIPTSKDFLKKVFEKLDEKYIEDIGRELGLTMAREYVSYFFPKVTSETLIEYLDIWFERFQSFHHSQFEKDEELEDKMENKIEIKDQKERKMDKETDKVKYILHAYVLNHEINMNFTLAIKAMLEGLIEPLIKRNIIFKDITNNSISFSFEVMES